MGHDAGPFQDIVGINFPGGRSPENFIHGEPVIFRRVCSDGSSEYDPGTNVSRIPVSGDTKVGCPCGDGLHVGTVRIYRIQITIPLSEDWPDCVLGQTSGSLIGASSWADSPPGWGSTPESFQDPETALCGTALRITGQPWIGQTYLIQYEYRSECDSAYDGCC